jgi:hypothetical protein
MKKNEIGGTHSTHMKLEIVVGKPEGTDHLGDPDVDVGQH